MKIGIDIGYSQTKAQADSRRVSFASVVGTPDKARFSLADQNGQITLSANGITHLIGEAAITQSRFVNRREDRNWIESDEYYFLFLAALSELTTASIDAQIVTGLPVAYFADRPKLLVKLNGTHRLQRDGRNSQTVNSKVAVIPQPFGTLASEALNNAGQITDNIIADGRIGVIDVGGKTTNLLSVEKLAEVGRETASVNLGAWDIVRRVRNYLADVCPELDLRDHQINDAIQARQIRYFGDPVNLSHVVNDTIAEMANQVIAEAGQLWNGGAALDAILITGGGAHLLGPQLIRHYRHARIVENPVYANSIGYWKLAQRLK